MAEVVIPVRAEREYEVVVGSGVTGHVPRLLAGAQRVGLIAQPSMRGRASDLEAQLADSGFEVTVIGIPDAEEAKTAATAEHCWAALGAAGFTRSDAVVSLGGGATTDLAGFVAATWLRGIRVVHVPTTLLAMVDAAVGGKTGINTPSGKNLVGAFWSPHGVVCDIATLGSLPMADLAAGMAEVVKVGFIRDTSILDDVEGDVAAALDPAAPLLADLVRRAVQVKADVVGADFRESSSTVGDGSIGREALNYGHTFGHAVERAEGYRWRHGAAVSVGMTFVAELAGLGGRLTAAEVDRHRSILESLDLPTSYAGDWDQLRAAMALDKKSRGSRLRFVVLDGIANPVIWDSPPADLLDAAYALVAGSRA